MKKLSTVVDKGLGRMSLFAAAIAGYLGGIAYLLGFAGVTIDLLPPVALALSVLSVVGLLLAWIGVDM